MQPSSRDAFLIRKRFQSIPEATLQTLKIAAVIGKTFDFSVLSSISKSGLIKILEHLEGAVRREMIWEKPLGQFSFVHDKIRETLVDLIPAKEKQGYHLLAAQYFENKGEKNFTYAIDNLSINYITDLHIFLYNKIITGKTLESCQ